MDRDHDKIAGKLVVNPGVLYTWGYGWENDVFTKPIIGELFFSLCSTSLDDIPYQIEIDSNFDQFYRDVRWGVYADILLFCKNTKCFFPRSSTQYLHKKLLKFDSDGKPSVDKLKLRNLLKTINSNKTTNMYFGKKIQYSPYDDCYCHLISAYSYHFLTYMLKKYSGVTAIPEYFTNSAAIDQFILKIHQTSFEKYYSHYQNQFSLIK